MMSVVLPVFNGQAYLAEAIDSIVLQEGEECELIVVDDGSTDGSAEIVEKKRKQNFPIRLIYQENQGPSAARNRGIQEARGEWIGFIDADDRWTPGRYTRLKQISSQAPAVEVLQEQLQRFGLENKAPEWGVQLGSALFKKTVFAKAGLFDPLLRYGEDFDFWMRLYERKIAIYRNPVVGVFYRVHSGSISFGSTQKQAEQFYLHKLKGSLQARKTR